MKTLGKRHWARSLEFHVGIGLLLTGFVGYVFLNIASASVYTPGTSAAILAELYRIIGPGMVVCLVISGILALWLSLTAFGRSPIAYRRSRWFLWLGIFMMAVGLLPIVLMLTYSGITGHVYSEGDGILGFAAAILAGMPGIACTLFATLIKRRSRQVQEAQR